jgi:hypothetical protein
VWQEVVACEKKNTNKNLKKNTKHWYECIPREASSASKLKKKEIGKKKRGGHCRRSSRGGQSRQRGALGRTRAPAQRILRQFSYFCTSKERKESNEALEVAREPLRSAFRLVSICTFVPVKQENRVSSGASRAAWARRASQYVYFCTSKASKLSIERRTARSMGS